jgi:hypothetical protein
MCNKNIKVLVFSNSPIESSVNMALILSGIFPYLEQLKIDCWDKALMNFLPRKRQRWINGYR